MSSTQLSRSLEGLAIERPVPVDLGGRLTRSRGSTTVNELASWRDGKRRRAYPRCEGPSIHPGLEGHSFLWMWSCCPSWSAAEHMTTPDPSGSRMVEIAPGDPESGRMHEAIQQFEEHGLRVRTRPRLNGRARAMCRDGGDDRRRPDRSGVIPGSGPQDGRRPEGLQFADLDGTNQLVQRWPTQRTLRVALHMLRGL
jgi:hypothetical protein